MNVLFLSELFYPHGSGAEYATFLYAKLLSQEDFDIIAVTNRFCGEPEVSKEGKLTVYRLPLLGKSVSIKYAILKRFDVLFSSFMKKMIKWADIVYIPRCWFSAIPVAKMFGKPVVVHLHDYIPICPLSIMYNVVKADICDGNSVVCSPKCIYAYEKTHRKNFRETLGSVTLNFSIGRYVPYFVRLSDAIICVSKQQKSIIAEKSHLPIEKLHIIYNPLPEICINDLTGDDFGYFGGPSFLKGFMVIYKAMLSLTRTESRLPKVYVTKFDVQNGDVNGHLRKLGFVPYGKLNRSELNKIYQKIRAVLVPSLWNEPWPYVVVEALVQGRFVIASKVGGIPEQVEGCKGAVLVNAGDYKALADSMMMAASLSREAIVDLGLKNKETFLKRFDNESTIKSFVKICDSIV
jgi:glycosyltransferase involved in cell wall biosynthesis